MWRRPSKSNTFTPVIISLVFSKLENTVFLPIYATAYDILGKTKLVLNFVNYSYCLFRSGCAKKEVVNSCSESGEFAVAADFSYYPIAFPFSFDLQTDRSFEVVWRNSPKDSISHFGISVFKRDCCLQVSRPLVVAQPIHRQF